MPLIIIMIELATEGKWSVTLLKVPYSAYWWRFLELEGMAMVWDRCFAFGDRQHTALLPCLPEWSLSSVLSLSVSVSVFGLSFTFQFCQKCHFATPPPPPPKKKEEKKRRRDITLYSLTSGWHYLWTVLCLELNCRKYRTMLLIWPLLL